MSPSSPTPLVRPISRIADRAAGKMRLNRRSRNPQRVARMFGIRRWRLLVTLACLGTTTAGLISQKGLSRALGVPVHFASHQLCSAAFVARLDPDQFFSEAIKPKLGPL